MQYAVAFLEGIITFISPCLLPMLPIYISYFAGGGERSTKKTLLGALGFVSGFTVIFVAMGTLAGTIGSFLREYKGAVNLISGLIVILFGLNFLGIFKMNLFRGGSKTLNSREMGFFPAMLFGIIFSLGWTPCVGAFLGSALMLAAQQGHVIKGMLIYGQEAAELLRNITVYHCMRRDQLLRLYPGKEGVIENLLRYLVKQQRIFYNTARDCYGDVPDCREDRELTAALWVLLDFIEKVEYHSPDNMPAKLVFFADGEVYEVVYVGPGKEALLQHALAAEDDSGQRLVIIEEEDQMQHLHIPHIAAYCMVDEQGCVQYFRKEKPCGQSHPLAADREHFE